ncbi:MAG TPA: GNAT family N-acetyltransferase [Solirubrobacteraceae bacterium]|nr:GNAT family N-acetyltransferase [Solirubrobacteraceae bacterium]
MLSTLRRHLRERGVRKTMQAVGRRLLRPLYSEQRMIVTEKDLSSIVESWQAEGSRVEELTPSHLPPLSVLNRKRGQPEVDRRFERYVEQGFHGFVAFNGDELVGYYWWVDRDAKRPFPDLRKLGLGIDLAEGEVYGSDFFLLEEHRGGGFSADILFKIERALRDRGYIRLWGYIDPSNRPARWIYSTRGYRPMWTVRQRRLLFFTHATREPA